MIISVVQLGRIAYATGLAVQERVIAARKEGRISDTLLLLEHTPVITLGRNAKENNIVAPREFLERRGVEVFECDRGGDVTFHGPGQLVGYPIFDLRDKYTREGERKTLGAVDYVRLVEEVLIRTCADFGIATERVKGMTGVWTQPVAGRDQGKVAAIGVHISRAVTSHGFALNVSTDLDYFKLIVPCGITKKPVTSMENELGRELPLADVGQSVTRNFGRVFNAQILWVETLEELLGGTLGDRLREPVPFADDTTLA